MKYKFFLSYVPLMILVSVFVISLAENYDGKATMIGYDSGITDLGDYNGKKIPDSEVTDRLENHDAKFYNGTDLRDNGLPYCIKVNKRENVVTIYKVGKDGFYSEPVKAMVCSVGAAGNTPEGVFDLGGREEWLALEGDTYGQYAVGITGNILFHSVPYFTQNKNDLEIEEYNKLGKSVSAGCVRLSVIDAKWIYDNCDEMTYVEIFESDYDGPLGKPVAAVISSGGAEGNWDPTDPDRENPYMGNVPVILGAYDKEVERYTDFNIASGVTALDSKGNDITKKMKVEGEVNENTCGIYKLTYSIKEKNGLESTATANLIIKDEEAPILKVDQKITSIGTYDVSSVEELEALLLENVSAQDGNKELEKDAITVDYSELLEKGYGICKVRYQAQDSEGNKSDAVTLDFNVDLEAPRLTLKNELQGNIRVSNMLKDDYLMNLVEATDNSGNVQVTLSRPLKYMVGVPYRVIYCAKDDFGNVSTLSVTYNIEK